MVNMRSEAVRESGIGYPRSERITKIATSCKVGFSFAVSCKRIENGENRHSTAAAFHD